MQTEEKKLTGYPSVDKPWSKYYSEEAINTEIPEKTMYQCIYDNNKDYMHNKALNYFGKRISYGELFKNIEKAAKAFQSIGVKKGDVVTIMSMHTPEVIYCIYALNRLGAVANMVYLTLSEQEIVKTVKNTESKALVVLNIALEKINNIRDELELTNVIVISPSDSMKMIMRIGYSLKSKQTKIDNRYLSYKEFIRKGKNRLVLQDEPFEKNIPAVIVYSSGSTGEAKGVMLSNYNLNAVAQQYKMSGMKFERATTYLNMLPPFVGFGISVGVHLPLFLGIEEIIWILPDAKKVSEAFYKYRPNHFVSGPVILDSLMEVTNVKMDFLVNFAGGGESISIEKEELVNNFLKNHGANVKYVTGYGMTELGATVCTGMNHAYKLGTIGIPLPSVNVKVVDVDSGNEVKINEIGELCFNAPNTMIGYYNNEQATNETIKEHSDGKRWLHTGDLGLIDEDGFIHFEGRIKRIYITKAADSVVYKLFPMRVEELFMNNAKVHLCGTIAVKDVDKINALVSFVSLHNKSDDVKQMISDLLGIARKELPEYSIPIKIIVLDEMPLTQSGKIDYKTLEKMV
ncbi:MAG: acyl--CoA ligase [Lachnospiraceae bacterium]|nr:acyl--CoA ligase [Lachnospiraceae bacterium]